MPSSFSRLEKWSVDELDNAIWGRLYNDWTGNYYEGEFVKVSGISNDLSKIKAGDTVYTYTSSAWILGEKYDPEVHGL